MRFAAVLFDLDGTLVDTPAAWVEAYLATLVAEGVTGYDEQRFLREIYSGNRGLRSVLDEHGLGRDFERIRDERDARYCSLLGGRELWLPGARELLESLHRRSVPTAIVTAAWRRYVEAMDAHPELERLTGAILTGEDYEHAPKPAPDGLLLAAERLGVDPTDCAYVGDQPFDVQAARAAGMWSVLVRGSHTPAEAPEPRRLVGSLHELSAFLDAAGS